MDNKSLFDFYSQKILRLLNMSVEGLILYHSSPVKNINATISSPNVLMNYKMSAIAKKTV